MSFLEHYLQGERLNSMDFLTSHFLVVILYTSPLLALTAFERLAALALMLLFRRVSLQSNIPGLSTFVVHPTSEGF